VPRTLILLRHAKAEHDGPSGDASRELTSRGERQARALGPLLAAEVGGADLALVSTAARAATTADLVLEGLPVAQREDLAEIYQVSARDLLQIVRGIDDSVGTAILVGPEPTISSLAAHLHDAPEDSVGVQVSLGVPTATACVLDLDGAWADLDSRGAHLRALVRPSV
jgi:phosphohistidine phosphatase